MPNRPPDAWSASSKAAVILAVSSGVSPNSNEIAGNMRRRSDVSDEAINLNTEFFRYCVPNATAAAVLGLDRGLGVGGAVPVAEIGVEAEAAVEAAEAGAIEPVPWRAGVTGAVCVVAVS